MSEPAFERLALAATLLVLAGADVVFAAAIMLTR
jgi:hypothetical protein